MTLDGDDSTPGSKHTHHKALGEKLMQCFVNAGNAQAAQQQLRPSRKRARVTAAAQGSLAAPSTKAASCSLPSTAFSTHEA